MTTIADRCNDPAFQCLLAKAHPRWWKQLEGHGWTEYKIAEAILRELCAGPPTENHPEVRALVCALERTQVADE